MTTADLFRMLSALTAMVMIFAVLVNNDSLAVLLLPIAVSLFVSAGLSVVDLVKFIVNNKEV